MSDEEKKESPEHLGLMSAMSKGYKHYVGYLKKGGRSGISNVFGAADSLLAASVQISPAINVADISKPAEEEVAQRILFLTEILDQDCRAALGRFRVEAQTGKYGQKALELSRQTIDDKCFKLALKEFLCTNFYLMTLSQGDFSSQPQWFQSFIAACSDMLDLSHSGLSAEQLMKRYSGLSEIETIENAAATLLKTLRLSELAGELLAVLKELFYGYRVQREQRLQTALTQAADTLFQELNKNA